MSPARRHDEVVDRRTALKLAALLITVAAIAAAALLSGRAGAQAPAAAPRGMVALLEDTTLGVGEWHELRPAAIDYRTDHIGALRVGPVDLKAGDVLDVRLHHQFDAEMPARGAWTVPTTGIARREGHDWYTRPHGRRLRRRKVAVTSAVAGGRVQSEHWSLWVMEATSVRLSDGAVALAQHEENWDWNIHHKSVDRAGYYVVRRDCSGCYVSDRVYFAASSAYVMADPAARRVQINGGQYPRLSVAVFR